MARQINKLGLDHIKQWEGLRTTAYKDVAGIWTIGYGHTAAAGEPKPKAGMKITEKRATEILMSDLGQYEQAVEDAVKVDINDNQFAALVSFTYNVGIGAFKKSTLLKKLNKGDYDSVPTEIMKWTKAGGKRVQGLVNRRRAEGAIWIKGAFVSSNYVKTDANSNNPLKNPQVLAPVTGLLSGLGGFISGTGPVQWAFAAIMVAAFAFGIWHFFFRDKDAVA